MLVILAVHSNDSTLISSVCKGSVLGPLIFMFFVNGNFVV